MLIIERYIGQLHRRQIGVSAQNLAQPRFAVLFPPGVSGLGQPVGVEKHRIPTGQTDSYNVVGTAIKEPHRKSSGIHRGHAIPLEQERRKMTGIADLHPTQGIRFCRHQGGVMGGGGALFEDAVGTLHQGLDRKSHLNQAPEKRIEMGHQKRRRYPLARYVSQKQEQVLCVFLVHKIHVVSAHRTRGQVPVVRFPPGKGGVLFGQQPRLNATGKAQIAPQRILLFGGQVAQAIRGHGIGGQKTIPHRIPAELAHPKPVLTQTVEGRVHFLEKMDQIRGLPHFGLNVLQPGPASGQLISKRVLHDSIEHGRSSAGPMAGP